MSYNVETYIMILLGRQRPFQSFKRHARVGQVFKLKFCKYHSILVPYYHANSDFEVLSL